MGTIKAISTPSVRDQLFHEIRKLILDGTFKAGMRLDYNQLQKSFAVSKTPLNEAVQALVREGLIKIMPRSGTFVSEINLERAIEAFEFRIVLEAGLADVLIDQITDADIAELEQLNQKMVNHLNLDGKLDGLGFLQIDASFHEAIIALSRNSLILERYCQANSILTVMRLSGQYSHTHFKSVIAEHQAIIAALRARDAALFRKSTRDHLHHAIKKMTATLASA